MAKTVRLTRYEGNPILEANPDNPWEAQNVSNAGAIMHDGKVHILYRAEGFEKRDPYTKSWPVTTLGLATSSDGFSIDQRRAAPAIGKRPKGQYGEHGVQDPRIAKIGDVYYVTAAGVSRWGDRVLMYTTRDFESFEFFGEVQPEFEMRTCGLFPQKFGDHFCMLLRYEPNMWIGYSRDLRNWEWERTRMVFEIKRQSWYGQKLGLGATPIRQDDAWLLFWHGKSDSPDGTYSLGVMWLDLEDPSKILRVQEEPVLSAETEYEREGYYPNVAYTCGAVEKDGQYLVYYGCADRCLALATVPTEDCRL
jgi:predicted GH43/DUF377 family glycosyl hydrolase